MKRWTYASLILAGVCLTGCPQNNPGDENLPPLGDLFQPARPAPPVAKGRVAVLFTNESSFEARTRVTMRAAGAEVFASQRRVPSGATALQVGPDEADIVVVEMTLASDTPVALPLQQFVLGTDFRRNETIEILIAEPDIAPRAPTGIAASDGSQVAGVAVSWNAATGGVRPTGFEIFRSATGAGCEGDPLATVAADMAQFVDESATPGVSYLYSVRARTATQHSACGGVDPGFAPVPPPAPPAAPTNVSASDETTVDGIRITWLAPNGGGPRVAYRIYRSAVDQPCAEILAGGIAASATQYFDATAQPGVEYFYSLRAVGEDADSPCSETDAGIWRDPPQPIVIAFSGLESPSCVNPGAALPFDVRLSGAFDGGHVAVFADSDSTPLNGNELTIASGLSAAESLPIVWSVGATELPRTLRVFAAVTIDAETTVSPYAAGPVRINNVPQLLIDAPLDGTLTTSGRDVTIGWVGLDTDDSATIDILLDRDAAGDPNGDEIVLAVGVSADSPIRSLDYDTSGLLGDYFVRGRISDCSGSYAAQNAPRLCLTSRLAGRLSFASLRAAERTIVSGGTDNRRLGESIDIGIDLNRDGRNDLLLGDPEAARGNISPGLAYYHESATGAWPATLAIGDMRTTIFGERDGDRLGERVALLPHIDPEPGFLGGIILGAPHYTVTNREGRVYFLDGGAARTRIAIELATLSNPVGNPITGAPVAALLGLDLATIGDIDADGKADFAIGATGAPSDQIGRLGFVRGNIVTQPLSFYDIEDPQYGAIAEGCAENNQAGFAIRGVPDVNQSGASGAVIGAPGAIDCALQGVGPAAGVTYYVPGRPNLFKSLGGAFSLGGIGRPEDPVGGRYFVGENADDRAGSALAVGDFDGDGRLDLAIAAPAHGQSAGRVYIVSDFTSATLPSAVALADVAAGNLPGAVIDGIDPFDQLGYALAAADVDLDGAADLVIGAPGMNGQGGVVYVLYGGPLLSGDVPLALAATCDLPGLKLQAPAGIRRFGAALSAGDVTGDGHPDVAIGAPGSGEVHGEAYLIFGR